MLDDAPNTSHDVKVQRIVNPRNGDMFFLLSRGDYYVDVVPESVFKDTTDSTPKPTKTQSKEKKNDRLLRLVDTQNSKIKRLLIENKRLKQSLQQLQDNANKSLWKKAISHTKKQFASTSLWIQHSGLRLTLLL